MIKLDNVSFRYQNNGPKVLKEINLELNKGQWTTILGANGSGKSTLAMLLNGLLLPKTGNVIVDEKSTQLKGDLSSVRQKVAFVFQNPDNQIVATSVEDDIAFALENMGLAPEEITKRVDRALMITKLDKLAKKEPYLLSGGEKQRLAIAGAMAIASSYLVLDEPTSMLDPKMSKDILEMLKSLQNELGIGIIYITNNIEEVIYSDRIIVLKEGAIVKDALLREVFNDYHECQALGIEMPSYSYLASRLKEFGYEKLKGVMTLEELVVGICR